MLEQSSRQRFYGIALHPYLVGTALQARHLRRACSHIVFETRPGMATTTCYRTTFMSDTRLGS